MGVETIGQGIATRLETITGLRVYSVDETPDMVNEFPCALVQHVGTDYIQTMGAASDRHSFRILLLVTKQDQPAAFDKLLPYLERTGTYSVLAALLGDRTLGGAASDITVVGNTGQSAIGWGSVQYLGTSFDLEVYA